MVDVIVAKFLAAVDTLVSVVSVVVVIGSAIDDVDDKVSIPIPSVSWAEEEEEEEEEEAEEEEAEEGSIKRCTKSSSNGMWKRLNDLARCSVAIRANLNARIKPRMVRRRRRFLWS